jgi:lipopolysaccharide export system permease protein
LLIVKAAGQSIWRLLRAPLLFAIAVGLVSTALVAPLVIRLNTELPVSVNPPSASPSLWFEERNQDGSYILTAEHAGRNGAELEGVTAFLNGYPDHGRIEAPAARLEPGAWVLDIATRYVPNRPAEKLTGFRLATQTTAADLRVHFTLARDLNIIELYRAFSAGISDSSARAGVLTSLIRQLCLPAILAGMVLIGFAFTSGYRRTNRYGAAVLYGVVLGFVVYVITELATRAGAAGVVEPTFAAAGPAFVAIVIGLTVLLFREDGRI